MAAMKTVLESGDILPVLDLTPLGGGPVVRVGPNFLRAQVLALTHPQPCPGCAGYLRSLHEVAGLIQSERAEALAVVTAEWEGDAASVPLPTVVDHGVLAARLSPGGEPVVAVTDRFGQLFLRIDAGPDHDFPGHQRILTTLLDIGISCPECGVPDVPCPTVLPEWEATSGGIRLIQ